MESFVHFKSEKTELKFEYLKYAIYHSKNDINWCKITVYCVLSAICDPYFQLFLTPKIVKDIKEIAKRAGDDRSNEVINFFS